MPNIEFFVSCGADRDAFRDIAKDAVDRLRQLLTYRLGTSVTITDWDYRRDTPEVVPRGALAATSLANVDRSDALLAIFGKSLPVVTQKEVRRAFERRQNGERQEVYAFVNPRLKTNRHDAFFKKLEEDFGEQIVWAPYTDQLSFQAALYPTLFRFLFEQLATVTPSLLGSPGV